MTETPLGWDVEGNQVSAKGDVFAALAAGSIFLGMTAAQAQPASGTSRSAASAPAQVAIFPTPQPRGQNTSAPLLKTNALRADPRWSQLKDCIDHMATSEAFRTCLQNIFGDMTEERPRP